MNNFWLNNMIVTLPKSKLKPIRTTTNKLLEWQYLHNTDTINYSVLQATSPLPGKPIVLTDVIRFHPNDVYKG